MSDLEERMESYRAELQAFEGEGPPTRTQLWHVARYESETAASWIEDMPPSDAEIKTVREDLLKALMALKMAEEREREADE